MRAPQILMADATANRFRLDDVRTATANVRRQATEILAACTAAGKPELAGELIRTGASIEAVRTLLSQPAGGQLSARPDANRTTAGDSSPFGPRARPLVGSFNPAAIPSRFDVT